MVKNTNQLPFGIGRLSAGWYVLIVVLLALIGLGAYAFSRQLSEGLVVTGMRNVGTMGGAAWGLYIAFDIYFVGVSFAGITMAALIRIFNLKQLKPISRIAETLTVVSLIMAGLVIFPDLGRPLRGLVNLFRYARPGSPFFGTFTLVLSGYLFGSLVYLYLDGRRDAAILAKVPGKLQGFYRLWAAGYKDTPAEQERHKKTSFWLAIAIVPLLVTAHSSLGFIFGLQVGRPGWFSSLQAPEFVVLAGVSGAAVVKRYLIVVPSQTHGTSIPYGIGSYSPTWVEYSVVVGIFALGTLLYIIFIKVFPIMEVPEIVGGGE
jgi:molybdopterin-containing oxidoreductase family membrane subunit